MGRYQRRLADLADPSSPITLRVTASFLGAPVLFVEGSRRAAAASGTRAPNGYERRAPSGLRVKALRSGLLSAEFHRGEVKGSSKLADVGTISYLLRNDRHSRLDGRAS